MRNQPLKGSHATNTKFKTALHIVITASNAAIESDNLPAHALLSEPAIPPYYRAKTLFVLAVITADWAEALYWLQKADIQLCVMRSLHVEGEDPHIDRVLDKLQDEADGLRDALVEEAVWDIQANAEHTDAEDAESDDAESNDTESIDTESDEIESDDVKWNETGSNDSAYQPDD